MRTVVQEKVYRELAVDVEQISKRMEGIKSCEFTTVPSPMLGEVTRMGSTTYGEMTFAV